MNIMSVTEITFYIKGLLNSDPILNRVMVRGEISNFKHHYSGHMYFTLKDEGSKIKCVMFKSSNSNLKFYPEDGMNVIVSGSISLYERDGQYQLYVEDMQPDGKGVLFAAFEQLKKKLESEGLFDAYNKLPLPKFPKKVGVVTSSTGAAVRDIINVITRRYPGIQILITPVLVQGSEAAGEISEAIGLLNDRDDIDVIIVARGGGSIEELWPFNEEIVARAIYNSKIPIITGVGHETDFTIADFVADLRAPTPSAAAELCVPDKRELFARLESCCECLESAIKTVVEEKRRNLREMDNILNSMNPLYQVNQKRQYIDSLNYKLTSLFSHQIHLKKELIKKYSETLHNLSPLSILSRGYAIAYASGTKNVIDDVRKVKCGDNIDITVKNGTLECVVKGVSGEEFGC